VSLTHLAAGVGGDLLMPLRELLRWLGEQALAIALGLVLGAGLARWMRARSLHWSWALLGFAVIVLARNALPVPEPLAIATGSAARTGRRWHREDIESGSDLRAHAHSLRTPLDAARTLPSRIATTLATVAGTSLVSRQGRDDALLLGHDERGRGVRIAVAEGRHGLVVGATGSGKTVTQTAIAVHAITRGAAAIVIDPKGDEAMRSCLREAARRTHRVFVEWSPRGPSVYNPYARGSETEIADKLLGGERFTEPHYLRQAQRYIGHLVRALRVAGRETSLSAVVEHLEPARLEALARTLPDAPARSIHAYLDGLTARQRADLSGIRDRLAVLAESDVGSWLDPATEAGARIELLTAIRGGAVVYFSLESDRRPLLTQMVGAAIVQDLLTAVAALQGRPRPALVVIDEFSALAAREVVRLFGRARSAGLSLLLGTQELADLRPPGGERVLEQVVGNLSLLIAHRQVVPASAELIAALAGDRGAWRVSRHSDGRSTHTRTRERRLEADRVMRLPQGWGAVLELADGHRARVVHVQPPELYAPGGDRR
jgi:hypothetical protein